MARDLVVFGEDWGALPSSTQHLIGHLAQQRKVIWVNSIGLRRPRLNYQDLRRAWKKLSACSKKRPVYSENLASRSEVTTPAYPVSQHFQLIQPRTLPAPRSALARNIATRLLSQQLYPVIDRAALDRPIIWTSLPTAVDVAAQLKTQLPGASLVYYCGDDFSALAGVDHQTVCKRQQELAVQADLIVTASESLYYRFSPTKCRLLNHGVDLELFTKPASRAADLPDDGRPIAGFYGSLNSWIDFKLLQRVITQLPNWHFVFVGRVTAAATKLKNLGNVHLLGERPHQQLPQYSQHWQAALLPFVDNPQIRACNPLKLREYLAAGRPIVSTPFPALTPYLSWLKVVNDPQSMVTSLRQCAASTIDIQRAESVKQESWAKKSEQLDSWLEAL